MQTITQDVTVTGDRQAGKTRLLLLASLLAAADGERVVYQCESRLMVSETFIKARDLVVNLARQPDKVYLANGDEHMQWGNGGRLFFIGPSAGRGMTSDLLILDGVPMADPSLLVAAKRVIRSELTS